MDHLRGKFIVFDGGEGCGKSTQAKLLRAALESAGLTVVAVHDPGATRIGEMIRSILLNPDHTEMAMRCEMLLYMAARAQMMAQTICPALEAGKVVISDRFISSTLAYQLGGDGLTADEIRAVGEIAVRGRWPDLTIILDMSTSQSAARVQPKFLVELPDSVKAELTKDRIELRSLDYHQDVRMRYLEQARANPERHRVIDGSREKEFVHQDVLEQLRTLEEPV